MNTTCLDANQIGASDFIDQDTFAALGVSENTIDAEELLRRYSKAGFLYPAKRERLAPFLPEIIENMRRAYTARAKLLHVLTYENRTSWASISSWRHALNAWHTQHLTSFGNPIASRAVILASSAWRVREGTDVSQQCWFRRDNRYAQRLFGTAIDALGPATSCNIDHEFMAQPLSPQCTRFAGISVERYRATWATEFREFIRRTRGDVYLRANELDAEDIELDGLDSLYRSAGLRRFRRILMAVDRARGQIVAVAIAHRGPLGLNFSFLENRCDLIVDAAIESPKRAVPILALTQGVSPVYHDFSPGQIPVVTDSNTAEDLRSLGGTAIQRYCQSIWLGEGQTDWHSHARRFYRRLERIEERSSMHAGARAA